MAKVLTRVCNKCQYIYTDIQGDSPSACTLPFVFFNYTFMEIMIFKFLMVSIRRQYLFKYLNAV